MGKISIKATKGLSDSLTRGVLEELGYELDIQDGYLLACKTGEPNLLIYSMGRELSQNESTTVKIVADAVKKLEKRVEELAGSFIPCVSYFVAKYSVEEMELCIVPVQTMRDLGEKGGKYSTTSGNYYYNYAKVISNLPEGAIVRATWSGKIFS